MQITQNFIDKANKFKIYCFYTCIDCDLKVSKHIMGPFSDIEKNHKDYSQKLCSVWFYMKMLCLFKIEKKASPFIKNVITWLI